MQQELPRLQVSQGATQAHKKLKAEKKQLVALHTIKASDGAFSHRAHTVQVQRAHNASYYIVYPEKTTESHQPT